MYNCENCCYMTKRKDNFDRHMGSNKHMKKLPSITEPDSSQCQTNTENIYTCEKCLGIYKTQRHYDKHIQNCSGIDNMTCPRCMKSFKDRRRKSQHVLRNSCKPVSIMEYLNRTNLENSFNNHIYINNYGKERTDYITYEDFWNIIKCCDDSIIPKYIKLKHFHPKFPENHNIKYKNNVFFLKINNKWEMINSYRLSEKLYDSEGNEVHYKTKLYDDKIKAENISGEIYEEMLEKTNYVEQEGKGADKKIKKHIIDVVRNG